VSDPYVLTDAGWPRPRANGWPVPWVAPTHNLGEVNDGRRLASVGGAICQVCGLGWGYDEDAYGFVNGTQLGALEYHDYLSQITATPYDVVYFLDGAIMHLHCARLSATMCPHIAGREDLACVRVPANDATPREDPATGSLVATYPAGDCELVPWPAPRRSA